MSLLDLLRLLVRHVRLLVSLPLAAALAAYGLTQAQPREFQSTTLIYTGFVSGYSLESEQGGRVDHLATSSAFDNLIQLVQARETAEAVARRLADEVARGALVPAEPAARGAEAFPLDADAFRKAVTVKRLGASDMIEIRIVTVDPRVGQRALEILVDEFTGEFRRIKSKEAAAVLDFFTQQTAAAESKLQDVVRRMRDFGVQNRVINYYEQTKYIAAQKEDLEREVQQERMKLEAAEAALAQLSEKLGARREVAEAAQAIVARRKRLSEATAHQALAEGGGVGDPAAAEAADRLRAELSADLARLQALQHTAEGSSREDLAREWLAASVAVEEGRARLAVVEERQQGYGRTYDVFAPLGSTLTSLEREVSIAQGEYLEMLHSLNQARMRQQNIDLSANLKVVDAPSLPTEPLPDKRALLVAVAGLAGFGLALAGLLAAQRLDAAVRSPERARVMTGLELAGAFPLGEEAPDLAAAVEARLLSSVQLALAAQPGSGPILLASAQPQEGVRGVALRLAERLRRVGSVAHLAPAPGEAGTLAYEAGDRLLAASVPAELVGGSALAAIEAADTVLVELPPLLAHPLPVALAASARLVLLAVRADRAWERADAALVTELARAHGRAPLVVLVGVRPDRLDSLVGEAPRARSWLRRRLKKLARLELDS